MKRTFPLLITAAAGFVLMVAFFVPPMVSWRENVSIWFDILASIAFILGGGSLLKIHLKKISDREAGWGFSAVTIIAFLVTLYVGLVKWGVPATEKFPDHPWSGEYNADGSSFWWSYEYVFKPLTATMFSLLAFFVASAAFRAFRAKNLEATLLLGTAFLILLGRTYAGVVMTEWLPPWLAWLKVENVTTMIMSVINTAGIRAITIGIALGIISTSLKVLLGVDRSYLGSGDD